MKKYVAVAGNIGVGKSTLVALLSQRLSWEPFYEPVTENPYLEDFYRDMRTWAFHSQVFFLTRRLRAHRLLMEHPTSVVQDRSVYEDAEIFALNLYRQGLLGERDYLSYYELYSVLTEFLAPPDLVVYLRATVPTLVQRIQNRSRAYERQIAPDYLSRLNGLYEEWIARFSLCPVLTVPADDLDFVSNPTHMDLVVSKVLDKLMGKDEVVFDGDYRPD
ncbi:MAG TPA: deoxynucleoside kinase [Anaerolineales bacterium]|nr:deoxynucleoside kinase [Anaerolineales bacterium]